MIRLLHTADIHLDSPLRSLALRDPDLREHVQTASRTAFTRIVDAALSRDVAALLIAGDLFDGAERSARSAAFLMAQFDRLKAAGIAVFVIKGNHDAENPLTGEMQPPDNVHVFDGRGGKVQLADALWIHGVSFSGRHAPESLLPKFPAPVPGAVNIALLHTSLGGAAGHDTYAPCSVADLSAMGFDYWALGHIHKRQIHAETPWIVMPGTPQGRDIGETGPKSATLLTVDEGRITTGEIPVSAVEFRALTLDVSAVEDDESLRAQIRTALRTILADLGSDTGILRLTLTGRTPRHWQIRRDAGTWAATADGLAQEFGRLRVERLILDLAAPAEDHGTATADLAALIGTIRREPAMRAELRGELDALLAELPPERRRALLPDEAAAEALLDRLTQDGAAHVTALLKGAAG